MDFCCCCYCHQYHSRGRWETVSSKLITNHIHPLQAVCTSEYNIGLIPGIAQALEDCLLLINPKDERLQLCQALSHDIWPRSLEKRLITYLRRIATSSTSPLLEWPNAEEIESPFSTMPPPLPTQLSMSPHCTVSSWELSLVSHLQRVPLASLCPSPKPSQSTSITRPSITPQEWHH